MGVTYEQTATYTCDQTGETVTVEGTTPSFPDGWRNMGALWFVSWAALRDYAAAQAAAEGAAS